MEQQVTTQIELDDKAINLVLKYLRNQCPLRKCFEDTAVRHAGKFSNHDGNFLSNCISESSLDNSILH